MKSTSLPDGTAVQFNLIDTDIIKFLDEYTKIRLSKIPPDRKPYLLKQSKITAEWFIRVFQCLYLKMLQEQPNIPKEFIPVAKLYNDMVSICRSSKYQKSEKDYELRCDVICRLLPNSKKTINNNVDISHFDYDLFTCIYEIIFEDLNLSPNEREVLNNCFGYSRKYRRLTKAEMAEKLQITRNQIKKLEIEVGRKADNIISKFRILKSCFIGQIYRTEGEVGNIIRIEPALFASVREKENNKIITNLFIAKVFSVICDCEMVNILCADRTHYLLIKRGRKYSQINIRFYKGLKGLLEGDMRTPETDEIYDSLTECIDEGYPADEKYLLDDDDDVEFRELMLKRENDDKKQKVYHMINLKDLALRDEQRN